MIQRSITEVTDVDEVEVMDDPHVDNSNPRENVERNIGYENENLVEVDQNVQRNDEQRAMITENLSILRKDERVYFPGF